LTWCRPCLTTATRAAQTRDADESSAQDTSSEDESAGSEGEEDENEESEEGIDADSNGGSSDRPQQEEEEGSPDPGDNGSVALPAPTPLSAGRPRRAPSARLVDDNGLTRFVPQAEADAWSTALAATAGPRSTPGLCQAPQHAQGLALFETFFPPTLIIWRLPFFTLINLSICLKKNKK
jgi:hypothetical protein